MKATIRELAKRSAGGRKRENGALFLVLFFLFFLIGAGVTWFSISRKTADEIRLDTYGQWKAAYFEGDEERLRAFSENPATKAIGACKVVGDLIREDALEEIKELEKKAEAYEQGTGERLDSLETQAQVFLGLDMGRDVKNYFGMFGVVGTMDEEARRLGRVTVKEGRFPEALGEIAMTEAQILRLGGEARLGEPITVSVCSKDGAAEQKTYRLCGILNTYGGSWQSKGYSLVTAVISDRAADDYSWEPLYDMFMEIDGDPADTIAVYGMESESMETISHFSFNSYGYGFRSKQSLTYLAVAFLVVLLLAALLILQILTVQMRSRSRQVGILKAIGATDRQVRRLIFWEITDVLWKALLAGTILGGGLTALILWGSGIAGIRSMRFSLDPWLLMICLAGAVLMVYAGAMVPVRKGSRIPARGEIQAKVRRVPALKPKRRYSKKRLVTGRSGRSFRVGVLAMTMLFALVILLPFYHLMTVMAPYRNGELAFYYEMNTVGINAQLWEKNMNDVFLEQIRKVPGVEEVYTWKNTTDFWEDPLSVRWNGIEESTFEKKRKNWTADPYICGVNVDYKEWRNADDQALVSVLALDTQWKPDMEGLAELVEEGAYHKAAFADGEEVLLFLPPYRVTDYRAMTEESEKFTFNADPAYRKFYDTEQSIKPGDTLTLRLVYTSVKEDENTGRMTNELEYEKIIEVSVRVGGIIRSLPQNTKHGLWNEAVSSRQNSDGLTSFTVLMSSSLSNRLDRQYKELALDYWLQRYKDEPDGEALGRENYEWIYRRTSDQSRFDSIRILLSNQADVDTEGTLQSLADLYGLQFFPAPRRGSSEETFEDWKADYDRALDAVMLDLSVMLAGGFVLAAFLLQLVTERLAEDRKRLGIFLALGFGKRELIRLHLRQGLETGILAVLVGNAGVLLSAWLSHRKAIQAISPYAFSGNEERLLYQWKQWFGAYPWLIHGGICLGILLFCVLIFWLPLMGWLRGSTSEQIRELGE